MVGACDVGLQIAQDSIDPGKALYACALAVLASDFLLTDT